MTSPVEHLVAAARARITELPVAAVAAGQARDALLVDVREPDEFAAGHLPGAINLPRGVLEFRIHARPAMACDASPALAPADRPLLLYCLSGGRSALAADSLRQLGFSAVASLAGGYQAWRNAGLPFATE